MPLIDLIWIVSGIFLWGHLVVWPFLEKPKNLKDHLHASLYISLPHVGITLLIKLTNLEGLFIGNLDFYF